MLLLEECVSAHLLVLGVRGALVFGVSSPLGLWLFLGLLLSLPAIRPPLVFLLVFALVIRSSLPFTLGICCRSLPVV